MGNGHPVAAVITRREIVSALVGHTALFSTFGGNPVSAAAAIAVLDVIEDERVLDRVQRTGRALRGGADQVAAGRPTRSATCAAWGSPAGWSSWPMGPAVEPDGSRARDVRRRMRHLGCWSGPPGARQRLKIRPPLALQERDVPVIAAALNRALTR